MANSLHVLGNSHDKKAMLKEWHNAGKAFSSATKTARKSARHVGKLAVHDLKAQGQMLRRKATTLMKDKPLFTFGGVLLVGAFLALLLKR